MRSRRHFFRFSLVALLSSAIEAAIRYEQTSPSYQVWLPIVQNGLCADDMPILGPASGAAEQAAAWLAARAASYMPNDVATIVDAYQQIGVAAEVDWFLTIAQMAHETGSLTSWWSQRPRRNPAGIGVTGRVQPGTPDNPPAGAWQWDEQADLWREGLAFPSWQDDAVPAHIGRLLAYALRDDQTTTAQQALIDEALAYRPLPASYRGAAPTICGLNGRWAVPGTNYGQQIVALAERMRQA